MHMTLNPSQAAKPWLAVVATAALLGACGGGSGSDTTVPPIPLVAGTDLPTTVEQSAKAVVDFAKLQLAATSETNEPLVVGNAKLATDDSAEPSEI